MIAVVTCQHLLQQSRSKIAMAKASMVRCLDYLKYRSANRSRATMETTVLLDVQERRMSGQLTSVIDEALDLAEECGWRYAIAYLISERVPSPIIQRLLFGGGRVRRPSKMRRDNLPSWKGANADDMRSLFDWLRKRRAVETCERRDAPCASRPSARHPEND